MAVVTSNIIKVLTCFILLVFVPGSQAGNIRKFLPNSDNQYSSYDVRVNQIKRSPAGEKIAKHPLGDAILETVTLQLKQGQPLNEVIRVLNTLRINFETEQRVDRLQFNLMKQRLTNDIDKNRGKTTAALDEFKEASLRLKGLVIQEANLIDGLRAARLQLNETMSAKEILRETLEGGQKDFAARIGAVAQVARVLSLIIEELTEKALTGQLSQSQKQEVVAMAQKVVSSVNPIVSLVDLTSTFDNDAIRVIIGKMEILKDSIEESLAAEKSFHQERQSNSKLSLERLDDLEKKLRDEIGDKDTKLKKTRNNILTETGRKEINAEIQQRTEINQKASEDALLAATSAFQTRDNDRSTTLKMIDEAINLLKSSGLDNTTKG